MRCYPYHLGVASLAAWSLMTSPARAQLVTNFEAPSYTGSAAGTLLTGQQSWYVPVAGSPDYNVFSYAGNAVSLIVDGYNLIHAAGIVGRGFGPGGLERSRLTLLNLIAASIEPAEIPRTIVVFDAQNAPPGLPNVLSHRGLLVRFAPSPGDADALIEELIRRDSAPRRATCPPPSNVTP